MFESREWYCVQLRSICIHNINLRLITLHLFVELCSIAIAGSPITAYADYLTLHVDCAYTVHIFFCWKSLILVILISKGANRVMNSKMSKWFEQVSQQYEMYYHDLEVMILNPGRVKLGVHNTSTLSHT